MPFPIPASVVAQMDELNAVVEQAYQAGDMSRLVETAYHTDAKAMPQGTPIVSGAPNLVAMFQSMKKNDGVDHMKLSATERHACDQSPQPDTVYELGTYTFYNAKKQEVDNGKFMMLWMKGTGPGYKIACDMFNSNKK